MKRIKGGWGVTLSPNENYILSFSTVKVYVYDVHTFELVGSFYMLKNQQHAVMSNNSEMIAAKEYGGSIKVIEFPTGKVLGKCKMENYNGYSQLWFSADDMFVYDMDWGSKVIRLNIANFKHEVIYMIGSKRPYYDKYCDIICCIDKRNNDLTMTPVDDKCFSEPKATVKSAFDKDNFIVGRDYFIIYSCRSFYCFDKNVNLINSVNLVRGVGSRGMTISKNSRVLLVYEEFNPVLRLYLLPTFDLIKEINCPYKETAIQSAVFIDNDKKIVVAAYDGAFIASIN